MKGYFAIMVVIAIFFLAIQVGFGYLLHIWLGVGFWKVIGIMVASSVFSFAIEAVMKTIISKIN